jgi:hypothetical protein
VAAELMFRLAAMTDNDDYRRRATTVLRLIVSAMTRYPAGFGRALGALDFHLSSPKEIAIAGDPTNPRTVLLKREVWKRYLPNKIVAETGPNQPRASELVPLLRERGLAGEPRVYVCEHYVCKNPVIDPRELAFLLDERPEKQRHITKAST